MSLKYEPNFTGNSDLDTPMFTPPPCLPCKPARTENIGTEPPKTTASGLVDSGQRVAFGTGAVREATGKGRCDLLPWDVVPEWMDTNDAEREFCDHMYFATHHEDTAEHIRDGLTVFTDIAFGIHGTTALLEVSHQFEAGAIKYKDGRNWEAGIPLNCYLSSAGRHFLKYLRGDTDEPHDRAVVWNLLCALWTIKHRPEMIDAEVPK